MACHTLQKRTQIEVFRYRWVYYSTIFWISNIFLSCDPSSFTLPAYQAEIFAPVLDIELNVEDLILADTTDNLQEDTTGLVNIHYDLSTAKSFEEIFPVEDQSQSFTIPGIPGIVPDFNIELRTPLQSLGLQPGYYPELDPINLNFNIEVETEEFIRADFSSGKIEVELTNELPFVINAGLIIKLINEGEENAFFRLETDKDISPGQNYIFDAFNLSGKTLSGTFDLQINNFSTPGGININLETDSTLTFNISFSDIVFDKALIAQPKIDLPSINYDFHIHSQYDARIKQLEIEAGQILLEVPGFQEHFILKTTFPTATQNGIPVSYDFSLAKTEIFIDGLNLDLSSKSPNYNVLPVELELAYNNELESIEIDFDRPFDGTIEISNIDYNFMSGYLGQSSEIIEERVELSIFNGVQEGKLEFDDPQIIIEMSNGAGAMVLFTDDGQGLYIKGKNERLYGDKEVSIGGSLEGFVLNPASELGIPQVSILELNKMSEPDLGAFFSILPTQLSARIPVLAGSSEVNYDQFLDDEAFMGLDLQIVLPLNISADQLILTDTSDYRIQNDPDKFEIQTAIFRGTYESQFPLELSFQLLFLDDQYQLIDTLFDELTIIEPAQVDSNGHVIEPVVGEFQVEVSYDQFEKYRSISYAAPLVGLHTSDGEFVRLLSSYKFYFKLIGEMVTDIDLNP